MTTILLADDHAFMRAGVESVLRGTEFDIVATVARGDETRTAIAKHDPDICILDVRMPGRNGIECLIDLRKGGDERPVVLLTAELEDGALLSAVTHGVNGIVMKDGAEDELLATLRAIAGGEKAIPSPLLHRALELSVKGVPADPLSTLARREREIANEVAQGARNREIAERLGMSEGTVKVYLYTIYQKLGIKTRTELALLAHGRAPVRDS